MILNGSFLAGHTPLGQRALKRKEGIFELYNALGKAWLTFLHQTIIFIRPLKTYIRFSLGQGVIQWGNPKTLSAIIKGQKQKRKKIRLHGNASRSKFPRVSDRCLTGLQKAKHFFFSFLLLVETISFGIREFWCRSTIFRASHYILRHYCRQFARFFFSF